MFSLDHILIESVSRNLIDEKSSLVQSMAWCRTGNTPSSDPWWSISTMHICGTRERWVNTSRLNNAYMCKKTTLQWRHNGHDGISNHQCHHYLLIRLFKAQINENIKAPRHWPLCWDVTGDRWIPRTKGQKRGKCFHLMTSPWTRPSLVKITAVTYSTL